MRRRVSEFLQNEEVVDIMTIILMHVALVGLIFILDSVIKLIDAINVIRIETIMI